MYVFIGWVEVKVEIRCKSTKQRAAKRYSSTRMTARNWCGPYLEPVNSTRAPSPVRLCCPQTRFGSVSTWDKEAFFIHGLGWEGGRGAVEVGEEGWRRPGRDGIGGEGKREGR